MDIFLVVCAILLSIVGFIGCILPALPGPPINYAAIWLVQAAFQPFSTTFLWITGIVTLVVAVLDYYMPVWTAQKYGATPQGITGSIIGMVVGIVFTPIGMILGLILGALIGDMIAGRSFSQSSQSAAATVFGTLISIGIKLITSAVLIYYTVSRIIMHYVNS